MNGMKVSGVGGGGLTSLGGAFYYNTILKPTKSNCKSRLPLELTIGDTITQQ